MAGSCGARIAGGEDALRFGTEEAGRSLPVIDAWRGPQEFCEGPHSWEWWRRGKGTRPVIANSTSVTLKPHVRATSQ
ncbi:hypothetical protein IFM12276_58170 [Nocardia sputorum]|uniref:Uncharacterized protein n=1 Tax=Nocardia sputorum TaxID=2984338 RepID=A0ABM8D635_9NOCA|nr:hypothetical protein IFM12276_58170 [Nocardia sputorum]